MLVLLIVAVSTSLLAGFISGGLEGLGDMEMAENLDAFSG